MSVFLIIWIENQTYFSSQNTGLLWVSRATIKSDTNWCHRWQHKVMGAGSAKEAQFISGSACQLTHGRGNSGNPRWACPCHSYSVKTRDDRTFDPAFPPNTFTLWLCAHCLPSPAKLRSRNSKAMKAWLWSLMHAWQMLRGPGRYSAACRC